MSLKVLSRWNETKLPVIFHAGVSGQEKKWMRKFARMAGYEPAIKALKDCPVLLGHSGTNEYDKAMDYVKRYPNVYLELSGQPPQWVKEMIETIDTDRIVFGSDWPYYHLMLPLAKVLLGVEGHPEIRDKIISSNAERLLAEADQRWHELVT